MNHQRYAVALAALVGVGLGYSLPRAGPDEVATPPAQTTAGAPARTCTDLARRYLVELESQNDRASAENAKLIDSLAATIEKAGLAGPEGTVMGWPNSLEEALRADGFSERVSTIEQECPDLHLDGIQVDCTEFPCAMRWASRSSRTPLGVGRMGA